MENSRASSTILANLGKKKQKISSQPNKRLWRVFFLSSPSPSCIIQDRTLVYSYHLYFYSNEMDLSRQSFLEVGMSDRKEIKN